MSAIIFTVETDSIYAGGVFKIHSKPKAEKMNKAEIKKMSMIERLQAMEAIWDSLLYEDSGMESPEWHGDILADRKRKIEDGKAVFFTVEELKATRNI